MPVTAVPGQTGDLQPEHQSGSPQAHFGHQPLKPDAVRGRGPGLTEVRIDHNDLLFCPAQPQRLLSESILALGTLSMLEYLPGSGLTDVKIGIALPVSSLNFDQGVHHEIAPCWWISRTMAATRCTNSPQKLRGAAGVSGGQIGADGR
jgi:hypothetical protein